MMRILSRGGCPSRGIRVEAFFAFWRGVVRSLRPVDSSGAFALIGLLACRRMLPASRKPRELRACDLCFLDVDATGPLFGFHEIIDIGAVRTSPDASAIKGRWTEKVRPRHPDRLTAAARGLNGFRDDAWAAASVSSPDLWRKFVEFAEGCVPVCHNPSFDRAFITLAAAGEGVVDLKLDYHWIGTESLAWPLYTCRALPELSLDALCAFLRIPPEPRPHSALAGAETCRRVYGALRAWWMEVSAIRARLRVEG
jgi:DNA polymerase III alpha subunit (gram-positive type)